MSTIQEACSLLADAEKGLRELMQRDIREQRYAELAHLAQLADGIARLARGETAVRQPIEPRPPAVKGKSRPTARSTPKGGYPRFERDGDKLVKIGWSKRAREEYEHRASGDVAASLIAAITHKFQPGELFTAADLLPLHDQRGDPVPDYQFYLALKWLHCEGVVSKHGRDRYAVEAGRLNDGTVERLWSGLPNFNGASR